MDMFEQAFAAAAEVSSDESWTRLQKYEEKEYYSATDVEINLDERTIGDLSGNVSTLGEDNSQYIQFIMDRYADGVDLTAMLIQVQYRLEDGQESVSAPVNAYASESRIRFGWPISRIATQKEQTIQFIVFCTGNRQDGEPYVLKTKPIKYKIEFTLGIGGTIIAPDEDWFLQFENVMNEKMNQVAGLTDSAMKAATSAKTSEEVTAQAAATVSSLASQVRADAESAKKSEENAEEWYNKTVEHSGVGYASKERAGVVSPQDVYVNPENGKMHMITETTETTMPNSCEGRLLFKEIVGKTEQNQYGGKNLIPLPHDATYPYTNYGVTFDYDEETGYITANGLAASTAANYSVLNLQNRHDAKNPFYLPKGKYRVTGSPNGGSNSSYRINVGYTTTEGSYGNYVTEYGNGAEFEVVDETRPIQIQLVVQNGYTANNLVFKPMICAAGLDDSFEPYVGGIPAPNPEYPQEIKSVVVSEIKTNNKNLIPYPYYSKTHTANEVTFTDNGDGSVTANGTATSNASFIFSHRIDNSMILGAGTYRLSGCPKGATNNTYRLVVARTSESNGTFETLAKDLGEGVEFTLEKDTDIYVGFEVVKGATVNNAICRPMVRRADVEDDTWELRKESVVTLSKPIELRRIEVTANDDYTYSEDGKYIADTIERIDGEYKLVRRIGESNGQDLSWMVSTTYIGSVYTKDLVAVINHNLPVLCSHTEWMKYSLSKYMYGKTIVSTGEVVNFYLKNESFTDENEVKTWMLENDFYFQYALLEPIITPLPIEDQIALNSLETFDVITYMGFDSEIKPEFEGKYGTSEAGGYTLEALLTARNADLKVTAAQAAEG